MALDIKPVLPTSAPTRSKPSTPAPGAEGADEPGRASKPQPRSSRPAPQRGGEARGQRTRRESPARSEASLEAPPYAGQTKVHISTSILPSLWTRLQRTAEELADAGATASVSRILVALLHLELPAHDDELVALARRWRLLRAGAEGDDPYRAERTEKYNVRVFPAQRETLEGAAKLLRSREGIRYPQSTIVNALIHFHGPADAADAEELLRRLDVALAGGAVPDQAAAA